MWLRTEKFGDDKDRVIIKSDGQGAYLSGDLAYYLDKRERGFDRCFIMLGADHHGYVGRMMAMCAAFGDTPHENLEILIGQMVNLVRDGQPLRMSKRAGTVVTIDDLVGAIGVDAARYALARYSSDSMIDIDLDLWAKQSNDNPVFTVQYAHARVSSLLRNAADLRLAGESHPDLLTHEKEGELLRALAEFPRVVASAAELRAPAPGGALPRGAGRDLPPLLRQLPGAADGRRGAGGPAPRPVAAGRRDPGRAGQRARAARGLGPGADVAVRAHEAGWAHAAVSVRGPAWLREPADPNALVPSLWSSTARKVDGVLEVGGVSLTDLVAEHGSPAYVLDEADFRSRARAFRDGFADCDVYYAGKAFLCTTVARWVAEEGLNLDVCSGGELAVAERAGFPMARVGFHGNNKSVAELQRAVELGVGRIIVDSFHEIERLAEIVSGPGRPATVKVMVRVTAGVEAHTHEYIATAHEDQKFGFSISSGDALAAVQRIVEVDGLELLGLHSHIGSQIFDSSGFEVAARRVLALHAQISAELGVVMPEMDLGGGFGIAYTTQDDPSEPAQLAIEMTKIVGDECRALRARGAPALDRARPRDRRSVGVHRLRGRHRQGRRARRWRGAHLRLGRRRDERQHPHRSLRRRLLLHAGRPGLRRPVAADPGGRDALRGRRHRGQGRVPAR